MLYLDIATQYTEVSLLMLRLMVAIVFGASGWNHLKDPSGRAKSMGLSKTFTVFLGTAEFAAAVALVIGVVTQLAAAGLILVGLGAIWKKVFTWNSGFWGKSGYGWHYDLMLLVMNLVILTAGGGSYVLLSFY